MRSLARCGQLEPEAPYGQTGTRPYTTPQLRKSYLIDCTTACTQAKLLLVTCHWLPHIMYPDEREIKICFL